jgi:thiol-disulfide isomerase/thioredoxin
MSDMNRRGWGLGLALGAVGLGAGAWLRHRRAAVETGDALAAAASAAGIAVPPLTPILAPLKTMDVRVGHTLTNADIAGRFVVLNFWAPWCPPCVREMPEIDQFARSPAGKNALVIGLAIDEQPAVDKFVAAHPVSFPISVLGYAGLAWARRLSNDPNVALPFTAVFDRSQQLAQHKFGATNAAELAQWVRVS